MSKAKYAIRNGDNILGILWENDSLGKILVTSGNIDPNFGLEIYDCDVHKVIKYVDLRDFLLEVFPQD